ncbi:MAG TPA: hypothetical protein ENI96_07955 [Sedimenticola thiotaurini]|uniref:Uncharacterized protein n=1 Tax=Sedimenticola thiotaurini TaxID=1543721 RepID=A0A831W8Y5_9GAMM|nr:hypothetical protein [Sedimenticola thiotaurini]
MEQRLWIRLGGCGRFTVEGGGRGVIPVRLEGAAGQFAHAAAALHGLSPDRLTSGRALVRDDPGRCRRQEATRGLRQRLELQQQGDQDGCGHRSGESPEGSGMGGQSPCGPG